MDLIELITATIAPSGRPISARSNGTIAFTSKLSGVPDLLLTLQTPSDNKQKLGAAPSCGLGFPVFHPCVRLTRWRDRPGELSFVPPDGKFVLASYEIDLLPSSTKSSSQLQLPVAVEIKTLLGPQSSEFEVRAFISTSGFTSIANTASSSSVFGSRSSRSPAFGGSSNNPTVEEVSITIPLPPTVKTLVGTRCSRGEFHHEGKEVTWKIPVSGSFSTTGGTATFRTGVAIRSTAEEEESDEEEVSHDGGEYKEDEPRDVNGGEAAARTKEKEKNKKISKKMQMAMPRCALVSFSVKGWLASGVKVESLKIVGGKGLGEGVKPYKGVKYLTKAAGVEVRC